MTRRRCIVAVALLAIWAGPFAVALPALAQNADLAGGQLSGRALVDALRRGGYVLYVRHTSTDFGQSDEGMTSFDECSKQRNLTDQGRTEARSIGAAIARLKIPIGDVLASPYCRTIETARLMFGRATPSNAVRGGPAATPDPERYKELRVLMSTPVKAGANTVISSHGNPFRAVAGTPYLAEGEIAVIEPQGDQRFRIVARITKDGWAALQERRAFERRALRPVRNRSISERRSDPGRTGSCATGRRTRRAWY